MVGPLGWIVVYWGAVQLLRLLWERWQRRTRVVELSAGGIESTAASSSSTNTTTTSYSGHGYGGSGSSLVNVIGASPPPTNSRIRRSSSSSNNNNNSNSNGNLHGFFFADTPAAAAAAAAAAAEGGYGFNSFASNGGSHRSGGNGNSNNSSDDRSHEHTCCEGHTEWSLFQIRFHTTRWNRFISHTGHNNARIARYWFSFGIIFGTLLMVAGPFLLVANAWSIGGALRSKMFSSVVADGPDGLPANASGAGVPAGRSAVQADGELLQVVLPGVTVPLTHFFYFFLTMLINAVLHELGHAISAVTENVQVEAFGLALMVIFPAAFVVLDDGHVRDSSAGSQLRIACAGVWHNGVIACWAVVLLFLVPTLLSPFYMYGQGVAVVGVQQDSGLHGVVHSGHAINNIGTFCPVSSTSDYISCLVKLQTHLSDPEGGLCFERSFVRSRNTTRHIWREQGTVMCCGSPTGNSTSDDDGVSRKNTHRGSYNVALQQLSLLITCLEMLGILCFEAIYSQGNEHGNDKISNNNGNNKSSSNDANDISGKNTSHAYACLAVRNVLTLASSWCSSRSPCRRNEVCLRNTESAISNHLIEIGVRDEKSVMFVGTPQEIARSLDVVDTIPRGVAPLTAPEMLIRMLRYMVSLSAALAVLNILPAYSMDGQHAWQAWLRLLFRRTQHTWLVETFSAVVLSAVTVLLVFNVVGSLLLTF